MEICFVKVDFLVDMMERKSIQLELMLENFNELLPLYLDEGGVCPMKNAIAAIRAQMLLEENNMQDMISAARGVRIWH